MIDQGRKTFRFDTFGSEAYWGDTLKLHQAIEGEKLGGVGPGVSPKTALSVVDPPNQTVYLLRQELSQTRWFHPPESAIGSPS